MVHYYGIAYRAVLQALLEGVLVDSSLQKRPKSLRPLATDGPRDAGSRGWRLAK